MSDLVERVARIIANAMGDNYSDAFKNKDRWIAKRGMSGGRFRDVNEPMQYDYLAAAEAAIEAMQTDAAPVVYWYRHPTRMDAEPFGTLRLTDADKADGWTETPLYAHPPVAAKDAEIAALKGKLAEQAEDNADLPTIAYFAGAADARDRLAALQAHADALAGAVTLAANRLARCALEPEYGTEQSSEWREWSDEARQALRAYEEFRR